MIKRILSQMNNNRLLTSISPLVDRDLLLHDLNVMMEGGSNYEHGFYASSPEGQIVIKSSGKFLKKGAIISHTQRGRGLPPRTPRGFRDSM